MADDPNTPASYAGPLWLAAVPSIVSVAQQMPVISGAIKTTAENLGVPWVLPWLALTSGLVGLVGAGVWGYRRAVGRGARWALWLRDRMPWA